MSTFCTAMSESVKGSQVRDGAGIRAWPAGRSKAWGLPPGLPRVRAPVARADRDDERGPHLLLLHPGFMRDGRSPCRPLASVSARIRRCPFLEVASDAHRAGKDRTRPGTRAKWRRENGRATPSVFADQGSPPTSPEGSRRRRRRFRHRKAQQGTRRCRRLCSRGA
jgi:hypothetical protein